MTGTRVLLLAALALSVVTSAGAFTAVDADRRASVTVVDDENAYLGLVENRTIATAGGEVDAPESQEVNTFAQDGAVGTIFDVTNQFSTTLTRVDASAEAASDDVELTVEADHTPSSLGVGERGTVRARIECSGAGPVTTTVDVTVTVTGASVAAERVDKEVTVTCVPPGESAAAGTPTPTGS